MSRGRGQVDGEKRSTYLLVNYQDTCLSSSGSICVLNGVSVFV